MIEENRARQEGQLAVRAMLERLHEEAEIYEDNDAEFLNLNRQNLSKMGTLAEELTSNGMADIALKGYETLYIDELEDVLERPLAFIPDDQESTFKEIMRADLIDGTVKLAPHATKVNPASAAHSLGRMLAATAILYREKVTKDGGFTSLRLTQLQEQFHRATREVAKHFNQGGQHLLNPFLGEMKLRQSEDDRILFFPHQVSVASVILAHGGASGNFRNLAEVLPYEITSTESQIRTTKHFANNPNKMPNDGRRCVPVQGLLFGSGG